MEKARYHLIDAVRGLSLVSMVIYHFCYDVFVVFGGDYGWYKLPAVHIWQQSICWTFILVSGFVWPWGRKTNIRRGLIINLCGLVITAVTLIFMPGDAIYFGILNFMGCAILLMCLMERLAKKLPAALGLALSFCLFLLFGNITAGVFGLKGLFELSVPLSLYEIKLLTPLGFPYPGFRSSDFFPILPWFFLYLCGYYLNGLFSRSEKLKCLACLKIPLLSLVGSKTLWVYMLHQPLCMLVCMLIFR